MEVVSGVLFLPRPLDLNGTEFSHKDGEERQGGGALAGSWLLFWALEVQVQIRLQESCSPIFFSIHNEAVVSRSWEKAAGFLELNGQYLLFLSCF